MPGPAASAAPPPNAPNAFTAPEAAAPPPPRATRWTLARRIAVLALAPAALTVAGGSLWLRAQMHQSLHEGFAQLAQDKLDRVSIRLRVSPGGSIIEPAGSGDEFNAIYSGWYWQADSQSGVQGHSRSLWDAAPLPLTPAPQGMVQARGPMHEPLLGLSQPVRLPGHTQPVQLTVLGPAQTLHTNLQRIDRILLASAVGLIALLSITLLVQVRVGLAPLRRLTRTIAAQPNAGHAPALDTLRLGQDLAPLQRELSALLARNGRVVERARAHAADLNHALKKPLALLSASASQQPQLPASEVLQHVTEMSRLIDRYQARTLSDALPARGTPGSAVPVAECLHQLLQAMRKLHAAQQLDWQLHAGADAPAWRWRGDRTDLEEALGNLLDNAGKWAASQVQITAQLHDGQLHIRIEDDGPGMSAAQLQTAGQRGLRFDQSVQGSGLGLSIASQIAAAWGGQLQLDKSPTLKGLRASLSLPQVHVTDGRVKQKKTGITK